MADTNTDAFIFYNEFIVTFTAEAHHRLHERTIIKEELKRYHHNHALDESQQLSSSP